MRLRLEQEMVSLPAIINSKLCYLTFILSTWLGVKQSTFIGCFLLRTILIINYLMVWIAKDSHHYCHKTKGPVEYQVLENQREEYGRFRKEGTRG